MRPRLLLPLLASVLPAQATQSHGLVHVGKDKFVPAAEAEAAGYIYYRDRWVPGRLKRKLTQWERQDAKVQGWKDAYKDKSKHYRIRTNAPRYVLELEIKPFLDALYKTYVEVFKQDFGLSSKAANKNFIDIYYGYEVWRAEEKATRGNPGYYVEGGELKVLFDPLDPHDFYNTVFHEGAHQFFFASLPGARLPVWLDEALATYFEACVYCRSTQSIEKLHVSPSRLESAKDQLRAARKAGKETTPTAMFLEINNADDFEAEHYALAWSFLYYLLHHDGGKHRRLIIKFLDKMNGAGTRPVREVFKRATRRELAEYEKGWADWVLAMEMPIYPELQVLELGAPTGLDIKTGDLLWCLDGQWVDDDAAWQRLWEKRDVARPVELVLIRRSPPTGMDYTQKRIVVQVPANSPLQLGSTSIVNYVRNVVDRPLGKSK